MFIVFPMFPDVNSQGSPSMMVHILDLNDGAIEALSMLTLGQTRPQITEGDISQLKTNEDSYIKTEKL